MAPSLQPYRAMKSTRTLRHLEYATLLTIGLTFYHSLFANSCPEHLKMLAELRPVFEARWQKAQDTSKTRLAESTDTERIHQLAIQEIEKETEAELSDLRKRISEAEQALKDFTDRKLVTSAEIQQWEKKNHWNNERIKTLEQQLNWFARNLGWALTRSGRLKVARYQTAKLIRLDKLQSGLKTSQKQLEELSESESKLQAKQSEDTAALSSLINETQEIKQQRIAKRADNNAAELRSAAAREEILAKQEIKDLVVNWIKANHVLYQTAVKLSASSLELKNSTVSALSAAESTSDAISAAQNRVSNAQTSATINGLDQFVTNRDSSFGRIVQTMNAVDAQLSLSHAQDAISEASQQMARLQKTLEDLNSKLNQYSNQHGNIAQQIGSINANLSQPGSFIPFLDTVLSLSGRESKWQGALMGLSRVADLSSANSSLNSAESNVATVTSNVRSLKTKLEELIGATDKETKKIIDEAVDYALKEITGEPSSSVKPLSVEPQTTKKPKMY